MPPPFDIRLEHQSPFARGSALRSGSGIDQSQANAAASGTLGGGGVICLFAQPLDVVNPRDVLSVMTVVFGDLDKGICGGAIGTKEEKMCVRKTPLCATRSHRRKQAVFVLNQISASRVYVCITVAGQGKNQVWIPTSAPYKKVDARFENTSRNDPGCTKELWTELLTGSQLVDTDDQVCGITAEQRAIKNHVVTQAAGDASPRKRTHTQAISELNDLDDTK